MRWKNLIVFSLIGILSAVPFGYAETGESKEFDRRNPRPSGAVEPGFYGEKKVQFQTLRKNAGLLFDTTVNFPGNEVPLFKVDRLTVNGSEVSKYSVFNGSILNLNRHAQAGEDLGVSFYTGWEIGKEYKVEVFGKTPSGESVGLSIAQSAPDEVAPVRSLGFGRPTVEYPYHHATLVIAHPAIESGTVTGVWVDGIENRDFRTYNAELQDPKTVGQGLGIEGESFTQRVDGARDLRIVVPCNWSKASEHNVKATVTFESGEEAVFEKKSASSSAGGYWDTDWSQFVSLTLRETAGIPREGEPVHAMLGLFSDYLADPGAEIRVVTYDPTSPKAGADGYVVARSQVTASAEWNDEEAMAIVEEDPVSGERVHRYDPTTTVELVFLADVGAYEEKVFQVLYGNPGAAAAVAAKTDLVVTDTVGIGQTVETAHYRIGLATNSGAVETVEILGEGEPVLLEHKLETNGAVHWNPGCYAPPTPWVHVSDWEDPEFRQITGPVLHRTRRYADLPHMESVAANVSYSFYSGQPYVISSSVMQVKEDLFVKALRNSELVFNHAVLDEFVWLDPSGMVKSMEIEGSREHPIHALEIPADTPWMAFVSREDGVGFASIQLEYSNTNLFGDPVGEAQPYIYVQNGPWIYWSRGIVYPFGGMNFSRLMRVRAGSLHVEKSAWVPFRFSEGNNPFKGVEKTRTRLTQPLLVHEWMGTDARTPRSWVMPILTMPFDEGVKGAVSGHREE